MLSQRRGAFAKSVEPLLGLAKFTGELIGFRGRLVPQHVEHLLEAFGDVQLAVECLPQSIVAQVAGGLPHIEGDVELPGEVDRIG